MSKPKLIANRNPEQSNGFDFLEPIPALIAVLDISGHIIRINQAFSEFIGQPQDKLIDKPFWDTFLAGSEVQRADRILKQFLESGGQVQIYENWVACKVQPRFLHLSLSPVFLPDGALQYVIVSGRDITVHIRAEECLKAVNQCLLSLGADYERNIEIITSAAGEIFAADNVEYYRCTSTGKSGVFEFSRRTVGSNQVESRPCNICTTILRENKNECFNTRNLPGTTGCDNDPCLAGTGFALFIGHVVRHEGVPAGVLGVSFHEERSFSEPELQAIGALAAAIGKEEDRYATEKRLVESTEKYKSIFTNIQDVYFEISLDGKVIELSPSIEHISQYKRVELLGASSDKFYFNPDDRRTYMEQLQKCGYVSDFHVLFKDKDGSRKHVSLSSRLITDDTGSVKIIGTMRDVTERHRSLEALRESEQKYHDLANSLPEVIFEMDLKGNLTFVNQNAIKTFGYEPEDFSPGALNAIDMIAPQDKQKAMESIQAVLAGDSKGPVDFNEFLVNRRDGTTFPVLISSNPIIRDGRLMGLRGIIMDISERKAVEEALKLSEEMFSKAFYSSPVGTTLSTIEDAILVKANESFLNLLGYSEDELIGESAIDLRMWDNHRDRERIMHALTSQIPVNNIEIRLVHRSGEKITCLGSAEKIEFGGKQYMLAQVIDITARRNAERELRKKNMELNAAMAVKTEFLSMVSHELRTPLVPILGYSEMILDGSFGELTDELKQPIRMMHNRAEALRTLIDDLLQLSKMERGIMSVSIQPVHIDNTIRDIIISYSNIDHGKNVSLIREGGDLVLNADPGRLKQVLQNLVDNSIKYSNDKVRIVIRSYISEGMGHISVEDDGLGIPPEEIPYIFDRFYQVEPVNTRSHDGSGLGLAISRELVELMGGTITVESELEKGSKFTVSLRTSIDDAPVTTGETDRKAGSAIKQSGSYAQVIDESLPGIAVIDDDEFTIHLLQIMLGRKYRVVSALNGPDGLELFKNHKIDLVFLDWMMPGMDGLTILAKLREDESTFDLPVVFLSGRAEEEAIGKAFRAGASGFVTKPFKKADLLGIIEKFKNPENKTGAD